MSTQHCGFTAPVASTTVYLFGAVHSTSKQRKGICDQKKTEEAQLSCVVLHPTDL